MYFRWSFCLPQFLTIPIILLSLLTSHKFFNNKKTPPISTYETHNTSSQSDPSSVYEVFLSFRGEDTRKGFTNFLYTYLRSASIHTLWNDNEFRVGQEIGSELLKAIKESKISIPIFSSKWCLLELAQMVECYTNKGQMIYPIFYVLHPAVLRHHAFRQHEEKFDEKTVKGWKDAMTVVGALKELELKKETDGHEGELVKIVVEKVLLELKKDYAHVPDNMVGIDNHMNKMERLLSVDSNGVKIVGIHGMGGLGKTTISWKENSHCS